MSRSRSLRLLFVGLNMRRSQRLSTKRACPDNGSIQRQKVSAVEDQSVSPTTPQVSTPTRKTAVAPVIAVTPEPSCSNTILAVLDVPDGFSLSQAICSYGYFGLAPNTWKPAHEDKQDDDGSMFERPLVYGTLHHEEYWARICLQQTSPNHVQVTVTGGTTPTRQDHVQQLLTQVKRILRVDWSPTNFWEMHKDAKDRGFGRTFRSPTLWEDMVKTITNCNMQWSGTVQMNRQLCTNVGTNGAFPTPQQVYEAGPDYLKQRCRLGYRAPWVVDLAEKFVKGELDEEWFHDESVSNRDLLNKLTSLKGFGMFASSNVMQLLGRHDVYPLDTETTRLFRQEHGVPKSVPAAKVHQQARDHYAQYEPYQFLAYWFDLWRKYEAERCLPSPRWTVETLESVGKVDRKK